MKTVVTDCRSEVGITVGLIDGIIAMARVLKGMDQSSPEVQAALEDLRSDEDFLALSEALVDAPPMTPDRAHAEFTQWLRINGRNKERALAYYIFNREGHMPGDNLFEGLTAEECDEKFVQIKAMQWDPIHD